MEMYTFEIWWNTGDPHWDNTPNIERFRGTIDGLNNYINSKMDPEFRNQEPGDVTEADIKELLETGGCSRMSGNEYWMIHSVTRYPIMN